MTNLDMDKLSKLRALMDRGATDGEKKAARTKATKMAAAAGMTLAAALSKLDAQNQQQSANFFTGFADWMEEKEPGYKAREAKIRAEREAKRQARCKELLAEFGSEEAVFAPTETEAAIRDALSHLDVGEHFWGYRDFSYSKGPTAEMWGAIRAAVDVPNTVMSAWDTYRAFMDRQDDRYNFEPGRDPEIWESAWESALEYLLDTLNTPTSAGIRARLEWMSALLEKDSGRGVDRDGRTLAALAADFAAYSASVQTGQPQNRQTKQDAICALLRDDPGLSDREIARRLGCSPQTVGNWRRKLNNPNKQQELAA